MGGGAQKLDDIVATSPISRLFSRNNKAFSPTYAHLRMTSPEPYGSSRKTLDNSPLAADGSD
jgi:hypothetical protein